MNGLRLPWHRCPDGVELEHEPPVEWSDPTYKPAGNVFRYRTRRYERITFELPNLEQPIVLRFVNARDDEARARFLSQFGFPIDTTTIEMEREQFSRETVIHYQVELKRLLAHA